MRAIRRGDTGPAVAEIRSILVGLELLPTPRRRTPFDDATETRRAGLPAEPRASASTASWATETWQALDGARWKLGAAHPLPLGARRRWSARTCGRCRSGCWRWATTPAAPTASTAPRTARAVAQFQREVGLTPDGSCGPQTMKALRRLGRKVVGGRPQWLREAEAFRQSGPNLVGKTHRHRPRPRRRRRPRRGGARRPAALDRGRPGVRPGRPARGPARRRRHAGAPDPRSVVRRSRCPAPTAPRSPTSLGADLLISLHLDGHANPDGRGRGDLPLRHRQRPHARPSGSGWPTWCSARSSCAPACATAGSTPRRGSCCG